MPAGTVALGVVSEAVAAEALSDLSGSLEAVSPEFEVEFSYGEFRYAFAGDWGSRLQVYAYPACFLTTPRAPGCGEGRMVASVNDPVTATVRFTTTPTVTDALATDGGLPSPTEETAPSPSGSSTSEPTAEPPGEPSDVPGDEPTAEPSDEGPVTPLARSAPFGQTIVAGDSSGTAYVLAAGASGSGGDYSATPLDPTGEWQVGEGSGSFSYGYPFQMPPVAVGGIVPSLGLSYDSGSVDGKTLSANGQASMAGMGWGLEPGYISRQYAPCAKDGLTGKGDLCWKTRAEGLVGELTIVLNGRSSKLVQVGSTNQFRVQDDPAWEVTRVYGDGTAGSPQNTDNDDEAFQVRAPDGTLYWFGYGHDSASTLTVPVYGNDAGEPCKAATAAGSWCQQAWRWGLDRVVDSSGNRIDYTYARETNYYARFGDVNQQTVYDMNGYLTGIEYGASRGATSADANSLVTVTSRPRCTKALTSTSGTACTGSDGPTVSPELWPDVPTDQLCVTTQPCLNGSPTFFSLRRYDAVWTGRAKGNTTYLADRYQLTFTLPQPGDPGGGGVQDLWLESVQRTGMSGTAVSLPAVNFDGVWLRNRVVTPSGDHVFMKLRVDSVLTETGGRIDVVYGHAEGRECTPGYVEGLLEWQSNRECFRQKFKDKWEWWHKYVVTRVALGDDALGYRLGGGAQTGPNEGRLRVYDYDYNGAPGWRYRHSPLIPAGEETWDDWRGYETVTIRTRKVGSNQVPDSSGADLARRKVTVYRGLHNSREDNAGNNRVETLNTVDGPETLYDYAWFNGRVAEETLLKPDADGTYSAVSRTYSDYNKVQTAINPWGLNAYHVYTAKTVDTPRVGGPQRTRTFQVASGGENGRNVWLGALEEARDNAGTPGHPDDDLATCHTWDANTTTRLRVLSKTYVRQGSCDVNATVLGRTEIAYDGGSVGAVPTAGHPTLQMVWTDSATQINAETTYDLYGRVKKQSLPYIPGATVQWTTTSYNPSGDSHDLLSQVTMTGPTVDADTPGFTATTVLTSHRGLVSHVQDANLQTTTIGRDGLGRVSAVRYPGNPSATPNVTYDYLVRQNNPSKITTHTLRAATAVSATVDDTVAFVDGWGRGIETLQANQRGTGFLLSATSYNEQGLPWRTIPATFTAAAVHTNPDAAAEVAHYTDTTYDAVARPVTVKDKTQGATNQQTAYTYGTTFDAVSLQTASGTPMSTTRTELDPMGRALRVYQYGNGASSDITANKDFDDGYAEYAYTLTGELDTIKKPKSGTAGDLITYDYDYDRLGRLTQAIDPDTGKTEYRYDAAGNTVWVDDASPNDTVGWIETSYDVLGRPLRREQVKTDTSRATLATWTYDAAQLGKGKLYQAVSKTGLGDFATTVSSYDAAGNALNTLYTYPGTLTGESAGYKTHGYTFAYNQLGQPTQVNHPALPGLPAVSVSTAYGPHGEFEQSTTPDGRIIGVATYDELDRPLSLNSQINATDPLALNRTYEWDARDRLANLAGATSGIAQFGLGYEYDDLGNPIRITGTRQATAASWCYTYDGINRLKTVTTGLKAGTGTGCAPATRDQVAPVTGELYDLTYRYAQGRLSSVTSGARTVTYSYGDSKHPHAATGLALTGGTSPVAGLPEPGALTYDAAGRADQWTPAGQGSTTYTYDAEGNLTASDQAPAGPGGTDVKHVYDVDGIRLARQFAGSTTLYLGPAEITKPAIGSATTTRRFSTPGSTPLATQASDGPDADTAVDWTWLMADAQGAIRLSKRDGSQTSDYHVYYPYGDPIPNAATLPNQRGYLNKTHDPNGDIRLDHRNYDPSLNVLTTPDPVLVPSDPQNLNAYAYSRNNPISLSDPSGLNAIEDKTNGGVKACNAKCQQDGQDAYNDSQGGGGPVQDGTTTMWTGQTLVVADSPEKLAIAYDAALSEMTSRFRSAAVSCMSGDSDAGSGDCIFGMAEFSHQMCAQESVTCDVTGTLAVAAFSGGVTPPADYLVASGIADWNAQNPGLFVLAMASASIGAGGSSVKTAGAIHGNSLKSPRPTTVYLLYKNGEYLKVGITSRIPAELRYPKWMGFRMEKINQNISRANAHQLEYWIRQYYPGPLNRERSTPKMNLMPMRTAPPGWPQPIPPFPGRK